MTMNWTSRIWMYKYEEQHLWTKQNGHLLWGKPRSNLEDCSAQEEEKCQWTLMQLDCLIS